MKKFIFSCFTGLILTCTVAGYSQYSNTTAKINAHPSLDKFIASSEELEKNSPGNSAAIPANEVNSKAVRDFSSEFKNASDVRWIQSENGFAVYFTNSLIKTRILYDKKGHRLGLIRDYGENQLPREVRNLVKSVYYDYSIYLVNEVTVDSRTAYVVKIQDKASLKEIKVVNDVMEVMKEYIKSE